MREFIGSNLIEGGYRNDPQGCPVYLALRKKVSGPLHIGKYYIIINKKQYKLTKPLIYWIDKYDNGHTVKPINVTVNHNARLISC